jgi:hypothetical protein
MPYCRRRLYWKARKAMVLAGNRRAHQMTVGYIDMTCDRPATRLLVVQKSAYNVTEIEFCDECAAEYHRVMSDQVVILADDPIDAVRVPVVRLTVHEWDRRFIWPEIERRLAACAYRPGDHVRHRMLGNGLVLDVYPTRDDVIAVVDFGREVRRLSLAFAPLERVGGSA